MNLVTLASHTVDLDLLPETPNVLDVGCIHFDFTREVLKHRPGARIVAMDPNPSDVGEVPQSTVHMRKALVGKPQKYSLYAMHSTGEGNFLCADVPWYADACAVQCVTIEALMQESGIDYFDLIKLDCEGSEFGILENWPGPIATQLSVEFHDWTGPWCHHVAGDYYERLFAGPLKDYEVVQHELSRQGEGIGHWDSVFRLRK